MSNPLENGIVGRGHDPGARNVNVRSKRAGTAWSGIIMALLALVLMSASAFAQTTNIGVEYVRSISIPRGGAFVPDAAGGHYWYGDSANGLCEITLAPVQLAGLPPNQTTCFANVVKSAGQVAVGSPAASLMASPANPAGLPAGTVFLYVADTSTATEQIWRFAYDPSTQILGNAIAIQAPDVNPGHGGVRGARAVTIQIQTRPAAAANGGLQDLWVGYLKSGDITKLEGVDAVPVDNSIPAVASTVGSTSDGIGVNSILLFGNDLYLGEVGGFGLSKIADPEGFARAACTTTNVCSGVTVDATIFAGGMATDWTPGASTVGKSIYIGQAPRAAVNDVLVWNPAALSGVVYSNLISPSYSALDGNIAGNTTTTTFTGYTGPTTVIFNPTTGDVLVGDDPQLLAATPTAGTGHFWQIANPASVALPVVTSVAPNNGTTLGGDAVTITGINLAQFSPAGALVANPTINFGPNAATNIVCASATTCSMTSPAGFGVADIIVTLNGQSSTANGLDQFTYNPPATTAIAITGVAPTSGVTTGGTLVSVAGQNLANYNADGTVALAATFNFGANGAATNVVCPAVAAGSVAPISTICTMNSPAGAAGTVDIFASLNGNTSTANASDKFTYITPTASLYAWGITAPKGGAVFLPGALGGHWWSSDHAQGLCRQDLVSTAGAFAIPGSTLHALNFSICASDLVGSAGQAVYDARLTSDGITHYVYVPDNAVKSTAVWRMTFDPRTETMVPDPIGGALATAMLPLADVRTLKPNGMALGPDGNLYVTDLTEPYIRVITAPNGDPRNQTIGIVAMEGDGRGSNGTQGFIGNRLYVSGNRAAQFFDITLCPSVGSNALALAGPPCGMASVPAPVGIFVAGTAVDAPHNLVYLSNSAGGGPATIFRYDASKDVYVPFPAGSVTPDLNGVVTCPACTTGAIATSFITGGLLSGPGTPNGTVSAALTCLRPWDTTFHPLTGLGPAPAFVPSNFAFVFGMATDTTGTLVITEDPTAGNRSGRGTMWTVPYIP